MGVIDAKITLPGDDAPIATMHFDDEQVTQEDMVKSVNEMTQKLGKARDFSNLIVKGDTGQRVSVPPYSNPNTNLFKGPGPGPAREAVGKFFPQIKNQEVDQLNPNRELLINNAAQSGVDIKTGLDTNTRTAVGSLNFNPALADAALDYSVRSKIKQSGITVPDEYPVVFNDVNSGELTYLRPVNIGGKAQLQPTLANPYGADKGDFLEAGPEVASIGLQTIMGVGGSLALGPMSGSAAGAAGSMMAITARRKLAEALGIPKEIAEGVSSNDELVAAAASISTDLGLAGVLAVKKLGSHILTGSLGVNIDSKEAADRLAVIARDSVAAAQDFKKATGKDLDFDLGQLTDDPALQAASAILARNAKGKLAVQLTERTATNRKNLLSGLKQINENAVPSAGPLIRGDDIAGLGIYPSESQVVSDISGELNKGLENAKLLVAKKQAALEQHLENPEPFNTQTFEDLQNQTAAGSKRISDTEDVAWWNFRTFTADKQLSNPLDSPIRTAAKEIDSKESLYATLDKAHNKFLEDLGSPQITKGGGTDSYLGQKLLDPRALHELLSELKQEQRRILNSSSKTGWNADDLNRIIGAVEDQVHNGKWTNTTDDTRAIVAKMWDNANQATVNRVEIENSKAVQQLLEKNERGEYIAGPGAVRKIALSSDRALRDVLYYSGDNPDVKKGLIEEMKRMYNDSVMTNGKFMQGAHNDFINNNSDMLKTLTGERVPSHMKTAQQLNDVFETASLKQEQTTAQLKKYFGYEFMKDPGDGGSKSVGARLLSLNTDQLKNLKEFMLKSNPELWQSIQERGAMYMNHNLVTASDMDVLGKTLRKHINENADKLEVILVRITSRTCKLLQRF
jgi:hypothetical protein